MDLARIGRTALRRRAETAEKGQDVKRFDVYLAALDPVRGSEMAKARPCVVVSPDDINVRLRTVTVVPLTSKRRRYPHRSPVYFAGLEGDAATDHIRSIDKTRLIRRMGSLSEAEARALCQRLVAMFTY